jgi:hypothetical protein
MPLKKEYISNLKLQFGIEGEKSIDIDLISQYDIKKNNNLKEEKKKIKKIHNKNIRK